MADTLALLNRMRAIADSVAPDSARQAVGEDEFTKLAKKRGVALPPSAPAAVAGAVLEVMLPDGARVRLEGAVDPALAAAVLGTLATSRRAP